ncbi:hypothetical protein P8452_55423 [Trifolium repens]|nr:hypothetical protein P8452_55423 [Trifolium repens]
MSRKISDASGENLSIMLCVATSVWMPVSRQRVFDFLRGARLRGEWDLLSSGGTMQEMVHIAIGGLGNSVSIIIADNVANGNEGLYLEDSWIDSSSSMAFQIHEHNGKKSTYSIANDGNLIILFRCMLRFNCLLRWFRFENIISSSFATSMLKVSGLWLMFRSTMVVMVPTGTLT